MWHYAVITKASDRWVKDRRWQSQLWGIYVTATGKLFAQLYLAPCDITKIGVIQTRLKIREFLTSILCRTKCRTTNVV